MFLFIYLGFCFCFSIYRRTYVVRIGINFSMMIVDFFFNMCYTSICSTFFHDFFFPFCKIMFNHSSSASSIIVVCRIIGTPWTVKSGGIFYSQLFPRRLRNLVSNCCYFILSEITESLRPNCITFQKRIEYKTKINNLLYV